MTTQPQAGRLSSQRSWPVPAALVALSALPLVAGTLRLVQLAVAEWVIRRPTRARAQRRIRASTLAGAPS